MLAARMAWWLPKMNILCLTQWFTPEPESSRGLPFAKWLQARGHEVTALTGFPNYPTGQLYPGYRIRPWQWDEVGGVKVLRVPLYPNHSRSASLRIANYLSFAASATAIGLPMVGKVDVIYAMATPPTAGIPPLLKKVFGGVPYLFNVTDIYPEAVLDSGMVERPLMKSIAAPLINALCKTVYGRADFVTAISNGYREILVERGLQENRVHTVYNWVDEDLLKPIERDQSFGASYGLNGRFNVVYAGNFGPFQGLDTVIKAESLLRNHPEIQIVLVGTGQLESQLKALAADLACKNLRFIPRITQTDMPQMYSWADALLVHLVDRPFLRATIPSKTQVSLAVQKPLVMAAYGESAQIVQDAQAGALCPPEDPEKMASAILQLFKTSPADLEAIGRRARRFYLENMSMDVGAATIEKLFERAVASRNRKPLFAEHKPAQEESIE